MVDFLEKFYLNADKSGRARFCECMICLGAWMKRGVDINGKEKTATRSVSLHV